MQRSLPVYHGAAHWFSEDMQNSSDWLHTFSESELAELHQAACMSQKLGIPLPDIHRDNFPLPKFGPFLEQVYQDVVFGRGFCQLRGLPVEDYDRELIARIYLGLGSYIGIRVSQNRKGHLLGHVKDIGHDPNNPNHRVYATNYRHKFHTDSTDVVSLLCLQTAMKGGESYLVSSASLYAYMVEHVPHLAQVLLEPWVIDRKGEIPHGKQATYEMPIFHPQEKWVTTIYARDFIEAAQKRPDVPRLTELQIEALDYLDNLCENPRFRLQIKFQPGDIQILHNHQILHARSEYQDWPEPDRKRHLLRLWLSTPFGRELPAVFSERYGELREGQVRGGIVVPGQKLQAPLEAE